MITETKSLSEFIAEHKIGMQCERANSNPHMDQDPKFPMDHWLCKFNRPGADGFEVFFSMGSAHKGIRPEAADVLDCLALVASGVENARGNFEDWCSEYGYDIDSRKAEKTFNTCRTQAAELKAFLGSEAYEALLWNTERL